MRLFTTLADLAFPRSCAGCGTWDTALCRECAALMAPARGALRDVVARAPYLNAVRTLRDGLHMPGDAVPFFPVWTLGDYEGRRREAILTWKNTINAELTAKMRAIGALAGLLLARQARLGGLGPLRIVPAPSRWRRRHDGRFVAGHLAEALAAGLRQEGVECQVADVLRLVGRRRRATLAGRGAKADHVRLARRHRPSVSRGAARSASPALGGWPASGSTVASGSSFTNGGRPASKQGSGGRRGRGLSNSSRQARGQRTGIRGLSSSTGRRTSTNRGISINRRTSTNQRFNTNTSHGTNWGPLTKIRSHRRRCNGGRPAPDLLPGSTCLLVDDVLTTGATLAGCARALNSAGASVVGAVVLAAAADPREAPAADPRQTPKTV